MSRSNDSLASLRAALDAAPAPVDFFLRDDDAGWDDARLFALLDCSERAGVPIDLAVIPQATGAALAASLCARKAAAPAMVGIHQHGYAHLNHEKIERKCEFGPSRSIGQQVDDLRAGRERMLELFGLLCDPIFTPPWNRCSDVTLALLADLGFDALSRSRSAPAQDHLPELPVDVDWCKHRRLARSQGGADSLALIAHDLALRVACGGPVGLMLHHAAMDDDDLVLLEAVLATISRHANARWHAMRDLLGTALAA